ncbi:MAG TPA: PIN domain-containing protein [Streptosporangiaceae bacterium]|jgi:hypothetical protein
MVLDAGALIQVDTKSHSKVLAECREASGRGVRPLIPSVVFAQVWREDPRQRDLATLRNASVIVPFTVETAKDVGGLLARSGTSDIVDAAVVVLAMASGAAAVTSDPDDIKMLADAADFRIPLITV